MSSVRSEILLVESDPSGTPLPSHPTSIVAPRPGPCRAHATVPTPDVTPLEWTTARQAGLIGGNLFGAASLSELAPSAPRGTPRSADGKSLVVPWSKGLLVLSNGKPETWTVSTWPALTDCVVANQAAAVACVRGERAILFQPDAAPPPKKPIKK